MSDKKVIITQTRSGIRHPQGQKDTLRSLGLGKIGRKVEQNLNPSIEGMIKKVSHLITVRESI